MKLIDVSTAKYPNTFAIVDDEDFDSLNRWKWYAKNKRGDSYAARKSNGKTLLMHRVLVIAGQGFYIDHKNRNCLDNRRENLRVCTNSQNQANSIKQRRAKGRYKGVYFNRGKFISRITFNGVLLQLGAYSTDEEAARVYDKKAIELFGEFARPNFPAPESPAQPKEGEAA